MLGFHVRVSTYAQWALLPDQIGAATIKATLAAVINKVRSGESGGGGNE